MFWFWAAGCLAFGDREFGIRLLNSGVPELS